MPKAQIVKKVAFSTKYDGETKDQNVEQNSALSQL